MKLVLIVFNGRIAPRFDTARKYVVAAAASDGVVLASELVFEDQSIRGKLKELSSLDIEYLVCGGIRIEETALLEGAGIKIISAVIGDIDAVIRMFICGKLKRDSNFSCLKARGSGKQLKMDRKQKGIAIKINFAQTKEGIIMPNQDGTGPSGQGSKCGKAAGGCQSKGNDQGSTNQGGGQGHCRGRGNSGKGGGFRHRHGQATGGNPQVPQQKDSANDKDASAVVIENPGENVEKFGT